MAKKSSEKKHSTGGLKLSVITSNKASTGWIALEDELPAPFLDVLLYSTKNHAFRVGYWDPVEGKLALSTVKCGTDVPYELIPFVESVFEYNPPLPYMTHWSYLPLNPSYEGAADAKTMRDLINQNEPPVSQSVLPKSRTNPNDDEVDDGTIDRDDEVGGFYGEENV